MNPAPPFHSRPEKLRALPKSSFDLVDHWHPTLRTREDRYENKFRKALFFFFREGPLRSLRKYKAKKRRERLEQAPVCAIVRHKESGEYFGGFQHSLEQDIYYFLPGAKWDRKPEREELTDIEKLDPFLGYMPEGWEGDNSEHPFKAIHYHRKSSDRKEKGPDLYAIGCGGYMLAEVLPVYSPKTRFKAAIDVDPKVLASPELQNAEHRSNDLGTVMEADEGPERPKLGYIASYHGWHTAQALDFLRFEKSKVIIEKPPCITEEDLRALSKVFDTERVFIAFHRRYAPWNTRIGQWLREVGEPVTIDMQIHEAPIGPDHWYFTANQGTRIAGNLCHWIDLAIFWLPSKPVRVTVASNEELGIDRSFFALHFQDGSMVHFTPGDLGDPTRGVQEWIRIWGREQEIRLDDHVKLSRWLQGRWRTRRALKRSKGHRRMNRDYLRRARKGLPSPYPHEDLIAVTRIQNAFIELARNGGGTAPVDLADPGAKKKNENDA